MKSRGLRNRGYQPSMFEAIINQFQQLADTDMDGVPDHRDCRPQDPRKHRIRPSRTMRKRLEQLPVYITDYDPDTTMGLLMKPIHIMDPTARVLAPKARTIALSVIKKYPSLVGQMEKKDPSKFTFVGAESKLRRHGATVTGIDTYTGGPVRDVKVFKAPYIDAPRGPYLEQRVKEIEAEADPRELEYRIKMLFEQAKRVIFKDDPESVRHKIPQESMAIAGFHELEHVKQAKDVTEHERTVKLEEAIPYLHRPTEREARDFAKQEIQKYVKVEDLDPEELEALVDLVLEGDYEK